MNVRGKEKPSRMGGNTYLGKGKGFGSAGNSPLRGARVWESELSFEVVLESKGVLSSQLLSTQSRLGVLKLCAFHY